MPNFCVRFFNTLLSSNGHRFKVLQRAVTVSNANTAQDAAIAARRDFELLEHVPDWKLHVDSCEVDAENKRPAVERDGQ